MTVYTYWLTAQEGSGWVTADGADAGAACERRGDEITLTWAPSGPAVRMQFTIARQLRGPRWRKARRHLRRSR